MNNEAYILPWYFIAISFSFLGFYVGWHLRNWFIFFKVTKEYFEKKLVKKSNILYLSKYKKKRQ